MARQERPEEEAVRALTERSLKSPNRALWKHLKNFSLAPSDNVAFSSGKRDDCRGSSASQGPICVFSDLGVQGSDGSLLRPLRGVCDLDCVEPPVYLRRARRPFEKI